MVDKNPRRLQLEKQFKLAEDPTQANLKTCLTSLFPVLFVQGATPNSLQELIVHGRQLTDETFGRDILAISLIPGEETEGKDIIRARLRLYEYPKDNETVLTLSEGHDPNQPRTFVSWDFHGGNQASRQINVNILDNMNMALFPDGTVTLSQSNRNVPPINMEISSDDFLERLTTALFPYVESRFQQISVMGNIAHIVISHKGGVIQTLDLPIVLPAPTLPKSA